MVSSILMGSTRGMLSRCPRARSASGGEPELLAKRARECLVRAVSRFERYRQNIRCTACQTPRRFGQAPCPNVAHHRAACCRFEGARQVVARYAAGARDVVERQLVRIVAFD